ncbi:hypothetical protein CBA19CS91_35990 [Paraburkholderia hospita]|nr:hypothetical protein CBA19CS91_35990 [Paraburkholderia hospita]
MNTELTQERKAEIFDHMLAVAQANGCESLTHAIDEATRYRFQPVSAGLPKEPGEYLVMLAPDNDWELRSSAPLMLEFDAFKSMPNALTYSDAWHTTPEDITAAVVSWAVVPTPNR